MSPQRYLRYRIALLVSLAIILPLGYWVRFSQDPLPEWLNDALGSVAYEIFWVLLVLLVFPKLSPWRVALGVCLVTIAIEFLQLWQAPFLQAARATLPGRLVLGNTFSGKDFPAYLVGSGLGWLWGRSLRNKMTDVG
jgi:glycopeptide antibiotics resistance protein